MAFLAIFIGVITAGLVVDVSPDRAAVHGIEGPPCLVGGLLGDEACPGCGLTRATAFVLQGEWSAAWRMHPGGFVIAALCGVGILVQLGSILGMICENDPRFPPGASAARRRERSRRRRAWVRWAILLGVIVPWLWRAF